MISFFFVPEKGEKKKIYIFYLDDRTIKNVVLKTVSR